MILAFIIINHDKAVLRPAELGNKIFDEAGWDPYLEDYAICLAWLAAPLPESKRHESKPEYRSQLPVAVFAYAVAEI